MTTVHRLFGRIGAFAGVACFIHCLAMPLLIGLLPLVGMGFVAHGWFEVALLSAGVLFTLLGLCGGYRTHRKSRTFAVFAAAVAFFLLAHSTSHEVPLMLLGGGCLVGSNLLNRRLCKSCRCCHPKGTDGTIRDLGCA